MTTTTEHCSEIERQIRDTLDRVPGLAPLRIAVTVDGACASLCGWVLTPGQRDQAEAAARATPGVSTVKNYLCVNLF
jgi:osmotically-inducible protein OsmY